MTYVHILHLLFSNIVVQFLETHCCLCSYQSTRRALRTFRISTVHSTKPTTFYSTVRYVVRVNVRTY